METKDKALVKEKESKIIIKKCHMCGHVNETLVEAQRCSRCSKAFLPLNYFMKIQEMTKGDQYSELFANGSVLHEEDLIKGIYVLW